MILWLGFTSKNRSVEVVFPITLDLNLQAATSAVLGDNEKL